MIFVEEWKESEEAKKTRAEIVETLIDWINERR